MSVISDLLKEDPAQLKDLIVKFKRWKKNREEYYKNKDLVLSDHADFINAIHKQDGRTGKTMNKVFSIPLDVYMSNRDYWDEIIKTKQFGKHPEWQVGKRL